jgi:hypothetical protein
MMDWLTARNKVKVREHAAQHWACCIGFMGHALLSAGSSWVFIIAQQSAFDAAGIFARTGTATAIRDMQRTSAQTKREAGRLIN